MAINPRIGTAKFVNISKPLQTRILVSERSKLLSQVIKSNLFGSLIPFPRDYKQNAADLFERVNLMSGGTFQYAFELKSDNIDEIPFRLLIPEDLQIDSGDVPNQRDELVESYIAVSYCWQLPQAHVSDERYSKIGNYAFLKGRLLKNGTAEIAESQLFPLPISPLLYNALLEERQAQSEGIWIDQVCINQHDESEKQVAVNSMDIVYKCARAVVIILDDIELTKSEQEALRFYIIEYEKTSREGPLYPYYDNEPPYLTTNVLMRNVYLKIVGARWFSRAWCMHETRLSKKHIFLIRCEEQLDSLPTVFRFTNLFMLNLISLGGKAKLVGPQKWLVSVLTRAIDDNFGVELRIGSYMQIFAETFSQSAGGNPRIESLSAREYDANLDKLSIAINTIGIGLAVNLNARNLENGLPLPTEDECCRRFTVVAFAAWDPTSLCASGHELKTNSVQRSWMRWPLLSDADSYKIHWIGGWNFGFDPSPSSRWIALHMGFFNRASGLRWATEARIKICADFLQCCKSLKLNLPNDFWNDLIIKTLACVMDTGMEWLTSTGEDGIESYKTPLVIAGLQKLLDTEGKPSQHDSTASAHVWTSQESPTAQSLIDLATYLIYNGPASKTESRQSIELWQPVCIANELGSKALTFVQRPPGREIFCATPMVLFPDLRQFYSKLFRAWTLVKGDPEREQQNNGDWVWKYHLMGKSRIFGNVMSSDEEHAFATIVNNVRIYGPIDLSP